MTGASACHIGLRVFGRAYPSSDAYGKARMEQISVTEDQLTVLQTVYDHFRRRSQWPTFGPVDRELRAQRRIDTARVIKSLPNNLIPGYGNFREPIREDELRMTVVAVSRCAGSQADVDNFLRAVRWMAEYELQFVPPDDNPTAAARVTSEQVDAPWVIREIDLAQELGKRVLPLLLGGRPFLSLRDLQYEDVTNAAMPGERFMTLLGNLAGALRSDCHPKMPSSRHCGCS
jgi:hypothetical protein